MRRPLRSQQQMVKPMTTLSRVSAAVLSVFIGTSAAADDITLPTRDAERPQTTSGIPHVQLGGIKADPDLSDALLESVGNLPGVKLGATRVSLPGAVGFQISSDIDLANPDAIVGGREFAHLHPDGSLHASLDPELARAAVLAGWATPHPWATQRESLAGFVLIYTPQTEEELAVVIRLVQASYFYVTGQAAPN